MERDVPSVKSGFPGKRAALAAVALAAALLAGRFALVVAAFARALPEGPAPVLRFAAVAAAAVPGPGLALLRFSRVRLRPAELPVFVLATGLAASGAAAWVLYAAGLYTRGAALAFLALGAAAGAWGAAPLASRSALRAAGARLRAAPPGAWIPPLLAALFVEGVFEGALGTPFTEWDALVTWDKWAADMGARTGLGGCLMGGYPQLLPALRSVFYKAAGTPAGAVFPAEHLMLHGFDAVFPLLLALSLLALGRRCRFPGLLALALLAACGPFAADLASGQADVPLAAFAAALAALLPALADARAGRRPLAPLALLFFAVLFAKGNGVVLAPFLLGWAWRAGGRPALLRAAAAFGVALAFAVPYPLHQVWLAAHPGARETSPFLVALRPHAAHTRLFEPDWTHLRGMVARIAPSARALAALGAVFLAAIVRPRTRLAALSALALFAFWFFTASYDWRNACPALALLAAVLAAAAAQPSAGFLLAPRNRRHAPWFVLASLCLAWSLVLVAAAGFDRSGAGATLLAPAATRWRAPRAALLPPAVRHMAMRPRGDLRNIFFAAPWAAAAERIWAGDGLYRVLAPKGCYAIQENAWHDAAPGDLAVGSPWFGRPPAGFVPVAELRRAPGYRTLWMFRPDLVPGRVLEIPAPAGDAPPSRDLFGAAAAGDPFAPYLAPFRDGAVLRLPNPRAPAPSE